MEILIILMICVIIFYIVIDVISDTVKIENFKPSKLYDIYQRNKKNELNLKGIFIPQYPGFLTNGITYQ